MIKGTIGPRLAGMALLVASLQAQAGKPLSVTVSCLTLHSVLEMAHGAILACRAKGFQVAATVVDREGVTQVALRDTLAAPLSLQISYDKAYTSAMFDETGLKLQSEPLHAPLSRAGAHLVFVGGSIPIEVGGVFYGALGVAGTPSAKTPRRD